MPPTARIPRSPTTGRRLDGLPESAIGVGPDLSDAVSFRGHTSDPTFNPPNRVAGPDDEVVFSEAVACKEHADCMVVESSITSDPGYEPPSHTIDAAPITLTITPQWPEPGWGTAMDEVAGAAGPFWDSSYDPADEEWPGTSRRPYAIIEDMRSLFLGLYDDGMGATAMLRSASAMFACRAIALVFCGVIFGLLSVGAVGVVLAVWLLKAFDKVEAVYAEWEETNR